MSTLALFIGLAAIGYGLALDLFNAATLVSKKYRNRSQIVLVPALLYIFGYLALRFGGGMNFGIATVCAIVVHIGLVVLIPLAIKKRGVRPQ